MNDTLRAATIADVPRLHELLSLPAVYEFLCDGEPPPRSGVEEWVTTAVRADPPLGLWLLVDGEGVLRGCARLSEPAEGPASAELTYALHPDRWGEGLASAMSRAVLERAFRVPACGSVLAGADLANARSVEVMRRLGMRFLRSVDYPAGPGVEYLLERAAYEAAPRGPSVAFGDG